MVRSVTPMISAASHHLRLPAMAFKITSCTFIIRSISADETICSALTPQGPIRVKRTDHVLIGPDRSHANNRRRTAGLTPIFARRSVPSGTVYYGPESPGQLRQVAIDGAVRLSRGYPGEPLCTY